MGRWAWKGVRAIREPNLIEQSSVIGQGGAVGRLMTGQYKWYNSRIGWKLEGRDEFGGLLSSAQLLMVDAKKPKSSIVRSLDGQVGSQWGTSGKLVDVR